MIVRHVYLCFDFVYWKASSVLRAPQPGSAMWARAVWARGRGTTPFFPWPLPPAPWACLCSLYVKLLFDIFRYETVVWPSLLPCMVRAMVWWTCFHSRLLYVWHCILQHGGSGKKKSSPDRSPQPVSPLNSTEPETIPLTRRPAKLELSPLLLHRLKT